MRRAARPSRSASVPRLLMLAALLLAFAAGPAAAKPALWVVRGATATIYLFGTIHALPPDLAWHSPKLDQAFKQAKELWLEIDDGGSYRASTGLYRQLGSDYTHPLSSKLTPRQLAQVDAALKRMGKADGRWGMEWVRPWVVALMVGGGPTRNYGIERGAGADLSLQEDAAEADKPVRALETKEQQLRIFADLPRAQELALLDEALAHMNDATDTYKSLLAAWMAGDVETLSKLAINRDGPNSDVFYNRILVERNKHWAAKIQELLTGSGTILIAAGAGHFAGPDSVQAQLDALGIKTERLQ